MPFVILLLQRNHLLVLAVLFLLSRQAYMGSHPGIYLMLSRSREIFSLLTDSIGVTVIEIFGFQKQGRLMAILVIDADVDAMRSVACSHVFGM